MCHPLLHAVEGHHRRPAQHVLVPSFHHNSSGQMHEGASGSSWQIQTFLMHNTCGDPSWSRDARAALVLAEALHRSLIQCSPHRIRVQECITKVSLG